MRNLTTALSIALLSAATFADNSTFTTQVTPAFRGDVGARFDGFDAFTSASATPNQADLTGSFGVAELTQLSPNAIITSTGNIYDPVEASTFSIALNNAQVLNELSFQFKTVGSPANEASVQLEWLAAGGLPAVMAPTLITALNSADAGEVQFSWDIASLAGLDITDAKITFASFGPHMSLDVVLIDAMLDHSGLETTINTISLSNGGSQAMDIDAGAGHAGDIYFVVGSATGTAGMVLDGVMIPLAADSYSFWTLELANSALFTNTLGFLDGTGRANASLNIPAGMSPALAGINVHHAAVTFSAATFTAVQTSANASLTLTL